MNMTLKFTPEHQWIRLTDEASLLATVGITEHAQETLGDIVFVSTPNIGDVLTQNTVVSEVESVKAASDVFAPVSGEVIEINPLIKDDPGLINKDPMGEGWFFKMRVDSNADLEKLLSLDQYHKSIGK
jgi:glycine cleavage system H protein